MINARITVPLPFLLVTLSFAVVGVIVVLLLAYTLLDSDSRNAFFSPETDAGLVYLRASSEQIGELDEARQLDDFNGDGVEDPLDVESFRMEPIFSEGTSGMVYVRCGRTGETLLAQAVKTPLSPAGYIGDCDGNGTDDVAIQCAKYLVVLGADVSRKQ